MPFITEDFLLHSKTARHLYHTYACEGADPRLPCHLSPKEIADNRRFKNLTEIWLKATITNGGRCVQTELPNVIARATPTLLKDLLHGKHGSKHFAAIRSTTGPI